MFRRSWIIALTTIVPGVALAAAAAGPADRALARVERVPRPDAVETAVDISDRVIRKAIVDSKDPLDDLVSAGRASFGTGGPGTRQRIDRRFREAEIPSCLTADAFKFDPPTIGPIGLAGFFALPYYAHAIATGRCRH